MKVIGHEIQKTDVLRQATLSLVLVICIGISFSIILWAKEPEMRPLMSDLRVADAVKVVDVLDQYAIRYRIDLSSHMLFVETEKNDAARIALARVGIIIEYPDYLGDIIIPKADKQEREVTPFYEAPWYLKLFRHGVAGLVIIVLIVTVIRPLIRALIYPEYLRDEEEAEKEIKNEKSGLL